MDYAAYRKAYFTDPEPEPRFAISGVFDIVLHFESYDEALAFYNRVLGPPGGQSLADAFEAGVNPVLALPRRL
jgi:hypothetical protein